MSEVLHTAPGTRKVQTKDWYEVRNKVRAIGEYVATNLKYMQYDEFTDVARAQDRINAVAAMYRQSGEDLMQMAHDIMWVGEVAPTMGMDLMVVAIADKKELAFRFSRLGEEAVDYYVARMRQTLLHAKDAFDVFYNLLGDMCQFEKELASLAGEMDFHAGPAVVR
jgi:hypothetical protein